MGRTRSRRRGRFRGAQRWHAAWDLIVADLRLADGASGIDAVAHLRNAVGADTPALIVSGDTSGTAHDEACRAGITLLSKPVVAATLKAAAETALAKGTGADHANVCHPEHSEGSAVATNQ
jgi:DNA-binding NtrC family response regulator